MSVTQGNMAARFREPHASPRAFIIPNPWGRGVRAGPGGARLRGAGDVERSLGGHAGAAGRAGGPRGGPGAGEAVVEATDLPVSADLEKGFGDSPEVAVYTPGRTADLNNLSPPHGELPTDAGNGLQLLAQKNKSGGVAAPDRVVSREGIEPSTY